MIVYHYTSRGKADSIDKTKNFVPSSYLTSDDSTFGPGWYFTDEHPSSTDNSIIWKCWNTLNPTDEIKSRIYSYLVFDIDERYLTPCKGRPNVYKLDDKLITGGILNISINYVNRDENNKVVIQFMGIRHRKTTSTTDWGKVFGVALLFGLGIGLLGALLSKK